jgi:hypothetical protein
MRTAIQNGWFQTDPFHAYFDEQDNWVVSATQVLKLSGLSNYDGVAEDVMENAARRGSLVHDLAFAHNKFGETDPAWLTEETEGYFNGYLKFLSDTGFTPTGDWIEKGIICRIHNFAIGLTPDIFGKIGRDPWVVEIKAAAAVQASWSIQTALQEMGIHGSNHVGRCRRGALQLFKDGRYKLHPHTNHQEDEAVAIAALRLVHWRMAHGQDLMKRLAA